jgi:hypothetical protein
MAGRAHGRVTREQLLEAGLTASEIRQRLRRARFCASTGVSTASAIVPPTVEARYLAAVLACGEGALLSGRLPRTSSV